MIHPFGRAQFLHPVPMGRAHTIFPTTNVSSDTGSTSGAGRGGKWDISNLKFVFFLFVSLISHFRFAHIFLFFFSFILILFFSAILSSGSAKGAADIVGRPSNKRGALRLRRERNDLLVTRPSTASTKKGTSGTPVTLQANYYRFQKLPQWQIYRYHVEFKPEVLSEKLRKSLVFSLKEMIGGYLFDGTQLFLTRQLEADVVQKTVTGRIDNVAYTLIIKFTGQVSMSESTSLQILK